MRKSFGIELINQWTERRSRREWDEHLTITDSERFIRISKDSIPAGRSPGRPKRIWNDLILD